MTRGATLSPQLGIKTMTRITTALTAACLITAGSVLRTANADDTQPSDSNPGAAAQSSAHDGLDLDAQLQPFELSFGAFQDDSTGSTSAANDWRVDFNSASSAESVGEFRLG